MIIPQANTKEAIDLFFRATLALAEIERRGIRIDMQHCQRQADRADCQLRAFDKQMMAEKEGKEWKRTYGEKMSWKSNPQCKEILFKRFGYTLPSEPDEETEELSGDKNTLGKIDNDFIRIYLQWRKVDKVRNTYLAQLMRETDENGFLHPFFNLDTVSSQRSSSSHPNFQNMPVRDPKQGEVVRRALLPRPGLQMKEDDYSGLEVRIAACYHQDPVMLDYLLTPGKDMHRDSAMDSYLLPESEVTDVIRYCAKNKWVFPQFYGSAWWNCAKALWQAIDEMSLTTKSGIPLKEWLADKGIYELGPCYQGAEPGPGTFGKHIQKCETIFWKERFKVYAQWKKDWYSRYLKLGYFDSFTGFRYSGAMRKTVVINLPVQGSAFHCLLWTLTQTHYTLKDEKAPCWILGQIHDSMVSECDPPWTTWYDSLVTQIGTQEIMDHWKWLIVPLAFEAKVSPVNKSWFDQKKWKAA